MTALFDITAADVADTNDDWYTPRWIFAAADLIFDLDVCAPVDPERRTCPARRYLTPIEDGLRQPWEGLVWMNPPFSGSRPWVERFAEHRSGLALLPTIRRQWFGTLIRCADAVALVEVDFMRPAGGRGDLPQVSVVAACGPVAVDAVARIAAADRYLQGAYHVAPKAVAS
jgi:hypothetical protein